MSDEDFNGLLESFNQAIEYERGERDDCRVTVLAAPSRKKSKEVRSKTLLKQKIAIGIAGFTEADLERVADYVDLLKFREQAQVRMAKRRSQNVLVA